MRLNSRSKTACYIKLPCAPRSIKLPNNQALWTALQNTATHKCIKFSLGRNLMTSVTIQKTSMLFFYCDDSNDVKDDDFWGENSSLEIDAHLTHLSCVCVQFHALHFQLWVRSRLRILSFLSTASGAGWATWRACQWVVISIPPSILNRCAVALMNW